MSVKRNLVDMLDRPGGRGLLGKITTAVAKRTIGGNVEVYHDGKLWIHRVDSTYFPDDRRFSYHGASFDDWPGLLKQYIDDAEDYWFRHYRPQPGDVVFDIGAGRGEDTIAFSRLAGPDGRVVAVEAHPGSYELLATFCRLNRLDNTTPLNVAVMDQPGEITMVESSDWRAHAVALDGAANSTKVPALTLDQICLDQGIDSIDFLKMNIEGAEKFALPGMAKIIARTRSICIACHDFMADRGLGEHYRTKAFVEAFLGEHGFRTISYPDDRRDFVRFHVFAIR